MSPLQSRPFPTPWLRTILCFVILACPSAGLADNLSDLQISEFSAEGDGSYLDEDGDPSDWIELRNTGSATINLGGYFLTDDPADPMQWQLPGVELDTGSLVVVFASGKDRAILGGELHTNFSLSAAGEYLALIAPDGTTPVCEFAPQFPRQFFGLSYGVASGGEVSEETYLETPAAASWFVPTADIGTTWRDLGFDDSQWVAAETGIGFGFGYEGFIGAGGDIDSAMRGVNPGAYIRLPFQVEDAASVVSLELSLLFEDGFAAYLNGVKVAAANTPALLAFDSTATAGGEVTAGDEPDTYDLDFAGKLISGENVLAIHLLNQTISSSDVLVVPELRGLSSDGSMVTGYMITPTPGAPNSPIDYPDYVRDTGFDVDRGFFEAPFDLTISCPTPGATLVYTTDGNSPSLSNGIAVTAPDANTPPQATIAISTTTVVRAAAFKDGLKPTNIDTQSYLFLADVLDQSDSPLPGYPLPWITRNGSAIEGDYGMDPDIVGPVYSRDELEAALVSLPTISIVTDIANLFDQQTGIQVNPQDAGDGSERPISVEMLGFEDGPASQSDAGMRMNGNASRSPTRPKHNFRVIYRNEYGTGRLEYPLFGDGAPVDRFNQFILRGGNGNSWIHPTASVYNNAMYIRDQWFRDAHTAMGHPEALQREVHVYFNGLYWGMHHLFERIEEEWAAERFGGLDDDWEGFRIVGGNNIEVIKGTPAEEAARMLESWRATVDAALAGDLAAVEQYLDLDSYIDYMLLNFHAGNNDWDTNNVRAMRRINPPGKYMWFCHDAERAGFNALNTADININVTNKNTNNGPTSINFALRNHPEYALRFADRAYKHLFNGGALTPENGIAQWAARADGIREAMKAESARWGDFRGNPPRTLVQWEAALQREYKDWFPFRTPVTISQLRATGLYPATEPPIFNQYGGMVEPGFGLLITNEAGDIYYTLDGTDPRLPGGAINPEAIHISGSLTDFTLIGRGAEWKFDDAGVELGSAWRAPDYDDSSWGAGPAPLGYGIIDDTTIATTVNAARHVTAYFRKTFEAAGTELITEASLHVHSDGGAMVYINGAEAARDNMPLGPVDFNTLSLSDTGEGIFESYAIDPALLVEGSNTIAVEVHNGSASSSDMVLDLELGGTRVNSENAAIPIDSTTTIRARSLDGGEWSALSEATFLTGTPATANTLVVSELHYNPGGADADLSEFIELANISGTLVDLAGVAFTQGIDFTFDDSATLAPGGRLILVADRDAFEATHGPGLPVAGSYSGRLANDGERLTLTAGDGSIIQSFRYNDRAPWPEEADGAGFSLVLIAPESAPDHALPQNWRASVNSGGSPGGSDAITFTGDPSADLLDYALGDPNAAAIRLIDGSAVFEFPQRIGADDVEFTIELSSDLEDWQSGGTSFLGQSERNGEITTSRWAITAGAVGRQFARLAVALRQP